MSISVTSKLNDNAREFKAGESTGFGLRLGVKFYNNQTRADEWTNYECAIFTRTDNQANYYRQSLVKGSVVEVSGSGCWIKTFEGKNGTVNTISILDPKLGYVYRAQSDQNQPPVDNNLDDDIPF